MGKEGRDMPTERFLRLPTEKMEVIRNAAIKELKRVSPEGVSINKIIQDAEISRGAFYTYFEDKFDLVRWLISDKIKEHQSFYEACMNQYGGNIWRVFDEVLKRDIEEAEQGDYVDIVENLVQSSLFAGMMQENMDADRTEEFSCNKMLNLNKLYQILDREVCSLDLQGFCDLMELHMIILMITLKSVLKDKVAAENAVNYYKRHMRILEYGVRCSSQINMNSKVEERHE